MVSAAAKEIRIETIFRYANVFDRALAMISSGKVDLKPLISHTFAFQDSIAAFERAAEAGPGGDPAPDQALRSWAGMGMGGKKYAFLHRRRPASPACRIGGVAHLPAGGERVGGDAGQGDGGGGHARLSPQPDPRIMLTHRPGLVAIVIGGMYNPFYPTVLEGFTIKLQAVGHQVLLVHVDSGHALDERDPQDWRATGSTPSSAPWRSCRRNRPRSWRRFKIPVISFTTPVKNGWVSSVSLRQCRLGLPHPRRPVPRARRPALRLHHRAVRRARPTGRALRRLPRGAGGGRRRPTSPAAAAEFRYEGGFRRRWS